MAKLIKVQRLRYGGPILHFDGAIHLRDAAIFATKVFRQYLAKYEKHNGKVTVRNTTIASDSSYGIFVEEGKEPVFEIAKTGDNNQYVIKNIRPSSVGQNFNIKKDVFESYFENNRSREISL